LGFWSFIGYFAFYTPIVSPLSRKDIQEREMSNESIVLTLFEWFLQYLEGILKLPFPSDVRLSLWAMQHTLRPL
jgi:hypothetical protein